MDNNSTIDNQNKLFADTYTYTNSNINPQKSTKDQNSILNSWLGLQKIIKEEITLHETSNHPITNHKSIVTQQQKIYQRDLQNYYFSYYESKLKTRETLENVIRIDNNIFQLQYFKLVAKSEDILRDAVDPIRNLLILLRGNFDYILKTIAIIDEGESKNDASLSTLIELFCHQFYDNLLIPDPEQEDLLRLCYFLIEKEISYMNSASVYSFVDEKSSVVGAFLKSYTKKQELKSYLSMTLGDLIRQIENENEACFDLNPTRIQMHLQKQGHASLSVKDKVLINAIDNKPFTEEFLTSNIPATTIVIRNKTNEDNNKEEEKDCDSRNVKSNVNEKQNSKAKDKEISPLKFNNNYSIDITQEMLSQRIEIETDNDLKDFYMRQLERINKDPEIFTNNKFFQSLDDIGEMKAAVLQKYKENFICIKQLIDDILRSLIKKITTIPYTLRCICKIIHMLIKAKFPRITVYEINAFIGEFIFGKCILPILINSDINIVITSSILSLNTRQCLKTIAKVLTRVNRGLFFEATIDTDFTIFNHYIIEIIPLINKFYVELIDIQLPKAIQEMITAQIAKGFDDTSIFKKLNKKNKQLLMTKAKSNCNANDNIMDNEEMNIGKNKKDLKVGIKHIHCCICYSIEDILLLVKIIRPRIKDFLDLANGSFFEKTIEKIFDKEYDLIEIQKKSPQRQFFLYFREPPNVDFQSSDLSNTTETRLNDSEDSNLVLQRIKFCIKKVLTGLNLVNSKDYSHFITSYSNENFLKALKKTLDELEEFNESELSNTIPLKWYSGYIFNNRNLLSDKFKENDYASLYTELLNEEKATLQFLQENSSVIITKNGMNARFAEKLIEKALRDLIRIQRIEQFMKIEKFITHTKVEVCFTRETDKDQLSTNSNNQNEQKTFLNFFYQKTSNTDIDDDRPKITITPVDRCMHKRLSYVKNEGKNSKGSNDRHVEDIREFILKFKQFKEISDDIEKGVPNNKIYQTLESYLELVKAKVRTDIIFKLEKESEYKVIIERIGDHIMKNMYNDIFPKKPLATDIDFQKKTVELEFITPAHLEIKSIYVNELISATEYVKKIDEGKSAYEKLKFIEMAHNTINNTIKFSSGKNEEAGADELSPLFHYIIIKAKPGRFYSNINYINTFLPPNLLNGRYGFLLAQMESSAEFITRIDTATLNKTKEEFEKKIKGIKAVL